MQAMQAMQQQRQQQQHHRHHQHQQQGLSPRQGYAGQQRGSSPFDAADDEEAQQQADVQQGLQGLALDAAQLAQLQQVLRNLPLL
jgi:hypothetical protein